MTSFPVRASLCALFAALSLYGCANDDEPGGPAAGTGGAIGGAGGAGGTTAGTGGTAGMTGGAGGASGMGGMGGEIPGCDAAMPGDAATLKMAATDALVGGCSFGSCHDGTGKRAMLVVVEGDDIAMKLVDKAACQVPSLMLVKSGGGQAALDGSWLWQKLVAPDDSDMVIEPNTMWGQPATCGQTAGTFGTRMPMTGFALSDTRIAAIRNWICAGAM